MPFRDPQDRRRYDRERRRLERAAGRTAVVALPPRARLRVAADVEAILASAVELATADQTARGVDKARALAQIAGVALRLIDAHDLSERLEAVERVLAVRRTA